MADDSVSKWTIHFAVWATSIFFHFEGVKFFVHEGGRAILFYLWFWMILDDVFSLYCLWYIPIIWKWNTYYVITFEGTRRNNGRLGEDQCVDFVIFSFNGWNYSIGWKKVTCPQTLSVQMLGFRKRAMNPDYVCWQDWEHVRVALMWWWKWVTFSKHCCLWLPAGCSIQNCAAELPAWWTDHSPVTEMHTMVNWLQIRHRAAQHGEVTTF